MNKGDPNTSEQPHARAWPLPWMGAFIAALCERGIALQAATAVDVGRTTAYEARDRFPEFAAAWDAAVEESNDRLVAEAWRRAHDGVDEPVFHQGEECGYVRKYSDRLLLSLLGSRRPKEFRERHSIEHSGQGLAVVASALPAPKDDNEDEEA